VIYHESNCPRKKSVTSDDDDCGICLAIRKSRDEERAEYALDLINELLMELNTPQLKELRRHIKSRLQGLKY